MNIAHYIALQYEIDLSKQDDFLIDTEDINNDSSWKVRCSDSDDGIAICIKELQDDFMEIRKQFSNHIIYQINAVDGDFYLSDDLPHEKYTANKKRLSKLLQIIKDNIRHDTSFIEIYSCLEGEEYKPCRSERIINLGDYGESDELLSLAQSQHVFIGKLTQGKEIVLNKTISEKGYKTHALSAYSSEDRFIIDFITVYEEDNLPVEPRNDFSSIREEKLFFLENSIEAPLSIGRVIINGKEASSISTAYHYKCLPKSIWGDSLYANKLYEYYDDKALIPNEFREKNIFISRVKCKAKTSLNKNSIKDIQIKFSDIRKEYPIQLKFTLPYGECKAGTEFKYIDPETNCEKVFYANDLMIHDPFKGVTDENVIKTFKNFMKEKNNLLVFEYENPNPDIYMKFWLSKKLDKPVKRTSSSAGAMGIIGGSKSKSKNGYKPLMEILDYIDDIPKGEIEIELFTITKTKPMNTYFTLWRN